MTAIACCAQGANPFSLVGTVVNTTDPQKTMAAPVQMVFAQDGTCVLTISPPLIGSGSCTIKTYDEKSGRVEITSTGAITIAWIGEAKGNFISGSYRIDASAQSGSFYLAIVEQPQQLLAKVVPQTVPRLFPGLTPDAYPPSNRPLPARFMAGTERRFSSWIMDRFGNKPNTTTRISTNIILR